MPTLKKKAQVYARGQRRTIGHFRGRRIARLCPPYDASLPSASHLENLRVARLDLLARALDAGGIVPPHLDLVEPAHPRLLLGERVDRMLTGKIDQELLRLARKQAVLGQTRSVRVWRRVEQRAPAR